MPKEILIKKNYCKKCNYEWIPRKHSALCCPKCKSYYWDQEDSEEKKND